MQFIFAVEETLEGPATEAGNMLASDVAISAAIMRQGHNIDSLMLKYHGVDWRMQTYWPCNQR